MAVQGIDVSRFQGSIDWHQVAHSGIGFAYVKATEGLQQDAGHEARNAYFQSNWKKIRSVGMLRGAYHFFRADQDAELQADVFLHAIGQPGDTDLPPMLDVETADGTPTAAIILRVHRCLAKIKEECGVTPIVYTYRDFWTHNLDASFGKLYPLWIAAYGTNAVTHPLVPDRPAPALPTGWAKHTLWQYGSNGRVPGIIPVVDLNVFEATMSDLHSFAVASRKPYACAA